MSGYRDGGVDFDNLFEPREAGDAAMSDVFYRQNGTDLSDIYAPASAGSAAGSVGYRRNGSDIGPLFCAKGTRSKDMTMTRGSGNGFNGYSDGSTVLSPGFGSLSPSQLKGVTCGYIVSASGSLLVGFNQEGLSSSFFDAFECSLGTFSAGSAGVTSGSGRTEWSWSVGSGFSSSGSETVTFT